MNRNSPVPLWAVLGIGVVFVGGVYVVAQRAAVQPQASVIVRRPIATPRASVSTTTAPSMPAVPSGLASPTPSAAPEPPPSIQKTYNDSTYHFQFQYPSDLTLTQYKTADYGVKALLLSNAKGNMFIWVYVTTPESIDKWNSYVSSTACTERVCEPFSYLACESHSSSCKEASFQGMYNFVNFQRRAMIKKGTERIELDTLVNVNSQEVPSSTSVKDLVRSGMLSDADQDFLGSFDTIFASLKFVM